MPKRAQHWPRKKNEPAWHKRQRSRRANARVLVRLGSAAGLLAAHHSAQKEEMAPRQQWRKDDQGVWWATTTKKSKPRGKHNAYAVCKECFGWVFHRRIHQATFRDCGDAWPAEVVQAARSWNPSLKAPEQKPPKDADKMEGKDETDLMIAKEPMEKLAKQGLISGLNAIEWKEPEVAEENPKDVRRRKNRVYNRAVRRLTKAEEEESKAEQRLEQAKQTLTDAQSALEEAAGKRQEAARAVKEACAELHASNAAAAREESEEKDDKEGSDEEMEKAADEGEVRTKRRRKAKPDATTREREQWQKFWSAMEQLVDKGSSLVRQGQLEQANALTAEANVLVTELFATMAQETMAAQSVLEAQQAQARTASTATTAAWSQE